MASIDNSAAKPASQGAAPGRRAFVHAGLAALLANTRISAPPHRRGRGAIDAGAERREGRPHGDVRGGSRVGLPGQTGQVSFAALSQTVMTMRICGAPGRANSLSGIIPSPRS